MEGYTRAGMKPSPFDYFDPTSVDEVLDLLAENGDDAVVLAGGQSLIPLLNLRLAAPSVVISPRRCVELRSFTVTPSGLDAGALVTAAELESSPDARSIPGLSEALRHIGHIQIRNRTTIGGSIAHADPAAELPALLLALDGTVTLRSRARGTRVMSADDFIVGPLTTAKAADELLTRVFLPRFDGGVVVAEIGDRPGDFATVGVVVALGPALDARIVVFGAGARPQRIPDAERAVTSGASLPEVSELVRLGTDASGDAHASADYRRHVAGTLVSRAIGELGDGRGGTR